ncbi:MFS transporter [Flavobacteriaceae bacterium]|jgi:MFS family permease|nr:MFS transporter [Flavobacteriaceae bacterium]MDA9037601.1 MFS transporter [Flavobacteriaceae bacterium]
MFSKEQNRFALSTLFFISGFCFSSWASRIPTLKVFFEMNEAQLGNFLFILPICSLIGLPISGWLVSRFDSRHPLLVGFLLFTLSLMGIGWARQMEVLVIFVALFAFGMRMINISMNTQAIQLQRQFDKPINGSFHGLWSLGGLSGILFATGTIHFNWGILEHLSIVGLLGVLITLGAYIFMLKNDREISTNKFRLGKPDPFIFYTGLVVFCAAVCEGGIYDWSSVYFREVVHAELFTLSYLVFMSSMTVSRFFTDRLIALMGMEKLFIISALVIILGVGILILFPFFWPSLLGFFITGFGVASVFPMSFLLAGHSKKYTTGVAISIVGTYSTLGVLIAPPFVGYVAHLFSLNRAFLFFVAAALLLMFFSKKAFAANS